VVRRCRLTDPIKPTLQAPGTNDLKLKYDEPVSNVAFKFNLRRYTVERTVGATLLESVCSKFEYKLTTLRSLARLVAS